MRIVFLGTSDYGEPALRELVKRCFEIPAVITQPDKKCGRGLKAAPCAIKEAALELGLKVMQPDDVNAAAAVASIRALEPDILLVVAYGQILSEELLRVPLVMPLNIHGSLLPAYRGPAPVNWAVLNGETVTGNSLMKLVRRMDAGPVIMQQAQEILPDEDAVSLERTLSHNAAGLLLEGLELIGSGNARLQEQDESKATYTRKLKKSDGTIDWSADAQAIRNRVRAFAGWPGAHSAVRGIAVKIFMPVRAESAKAAAAPGTVIAVSKTAISVACGSGSLAIASLQPAGSRRMTAAEFIAGHRIAPGDKFGN
jgi:methionyl-tRNA formyltransferase